MIPGDPARNTEWLTYTTRRELVQKVEEEAQKLFKEQGYQDGFAKDVLDVLLFLELAEPFDA